MMTSPSSKFNTAKHQHPVNTTDSPQNFLNTQPLHNTPAMAPK